MSGVLPVDEPGRWVVDGRAPAWVDRTGRRWTLDAVDVGDQLWTAAPDQTLAEAFGALVGLVRGGVLPTDEVADIVTGLEDENEALRSQLAAAHDVIRRLLDGWCVIRTTASWAREWHGPNGEIEATSAAHDAALDAADATPTDDAAMLNVLCECGHRAGLHGHDGGVPGSRCYERLNDERLCPCERFVSTGVLPDATPTEAHDG